MSRETIEAVNESRGPTTARDQTITIEKEYTEKINFFNEKYN